MNSRKRPTIGAEQALSLISDQWFIAIVHRLMSGTKRYLELQRAIPTISKKMLTQTLRSMERDGIVERKVFPVNPPHTEYSLTALGESLVPPLQMLCHWGMEHFPEVEENRRRWEGNEEGSSNIDGEYRQPSSA